MLDDFSRVLKRKQADYVLLENELAPMNSAEEKAEGGGTMFDGDVDDVLDLSLKGESKLDKFYRWVAAQ